MTTLTRRTTLAAGAALALGPALSLADPKAPAPATPAPRAPRPLAFDPKKLKGLSEKLLVSHWENNYGGALKNLLKVEDELTRVTKDTAPFLVAGLRERQLTFGNSVALHELYFDNLGGSGRPAGTLEQALVAEFGSVARWEELFRASAAGLYGGSGWVVLDASADGALRIHASGHHTQFPVGAAPLLVLDMYEHSYALDYGAAAAKYVDAFFQNVQWDAVSARLEKTRSAR
ncbi:MAG: Fe-Mn family superoxide dismutase [Myxococcaceae bacterium]